MPATRLVHLLRETNEVIREYTLDQEVCEAMHEEKMVIILLRAAAQNLKDAKGYYEIAQTKKAFRRAG